MLGAHNLSDTSETGRISITPSEIHIHPDWDSFKLKYDADIALLIFESQISFTKYIQPICLSAEDLDSTEGYVAGWGQSSKTKNQEDTPKQVVVPIVSNEVCFLSSQFLVALSSLRTICAGARDGTGPCRGDSY